VTSDVRSTFGSLSDILSVIPSVDVDPDGLVSLRGDANVLILIDGKPSSQFSGTAAGDNLQSIPAKHIERIEILTTPPAQFKADGASRSHQHHHRKKRSEGGFGSVQASRGSEGRSVLGLDGSYASGPLALSGQYALNDRQSVSASASWADRGGLRTYTELNQGSTASGAVESSSQRLNSGHDPETDLDERLGFTQKLRSDGETLDLSLHRSSSQQYEHYDYVNDSFIPPAATAYNNLTFHEDHGTTDFGADYVRPLSKTRSLKLGYASSRMITDSPMWATTWTLRPACRLSTRISPVRPWRPKVGPRRSNARRA